MVRDQDDLTPYERFAFFLVRVIRNPYFIAFYSLGTFAWWYAHPPQGGWAQAFNADAYPWPAWTSAASLLALWIESAVGVGQYLQQRRDLQAAARQEAMLRALTIDTEATEATLAAVQTLLKRDGESLCRVESGLRILSAQVDRIEIEVTNRARRHRAPDQDPLQP